MNKIVNLNENKIKKDLELILLEDKELLKEFINLSES
jgi:hypothetical protein